MTLVDKVWLIPLATFLYLTFILSATEINGLSIEDRVTLSDRKIQPNPKPWINSFVANVRVTIRNMTSKWRIPNVNTGKDTVPRIQLLTTSARPSMSPTTIKRRKTTTSIRKSSPSTSTPGSLISERCDSKSCESDNMEILERCQEFCIINNANSTEGSTSTPFTTSTSTKVTTTTKPSKPMTSKSTSTTSKKPHGCKSDSESELEGCVCNFDLSPVCGTNSKTYSNLCVLECAKECTSGLELQHNGRCKNVVH